MKKIKIILLVICLVILIAIAIVIGLFVSGNKKTKFVVEAGNSMFEFNQKLGSSDNVHSKSTYDSGYFEDFRLRKSF